MSQNNQDTKLPQPCRDYFLVELNAEFDPKRGVLYSSTSHSACYSLRSIFRVRNLLPYRCKPGGSAPNPRRFEDYGDSPPAKVRCNYQWILMLRADTIVCPRIYKTFMYLNMHIMTCCSAKHDHTSSIYIIAKQFPYENMEPVTRLEIYHDMRDMCPAFTTT